MSDPDIFEDFCTVEGDEDKPAQRLESQENAAQEERLQKALVGDNTGEGQLRNIVILSNNLLELLHLRLDVIPDSPEPGQSEASVALSSPPHEPDRGLGQQPAEEEEEDTEEGQGGVVEVEGDDQTQAEPQQPAQADAAGVEGG